MPATTLLLSLLASNAMAATVELPRYPAASPDGSSVVFSWRGDLWRSPSAGGEAVRLTTNPGDDLRSIFTRDGTTLVFESSREGARNIWAMPAAGGEPRQLTFGDSPVLLGGLGTGADGKPVPLDLRLGLSDGSFTEVIGVTGGKLEAGDLVYVGVAGGPNTTGPAAPPRPAGPRL